MQNTKNLQLCVALSGFLFLSSEAHSSAFMLNEQSTSASGRSYAGGAAIADDASTIFYNPAGMTELKRAEAYIGTFVIAPNADISNRGSTGGGTPFTGQSGQGFDPQMAGHMYFATPVAEGLWTGLAVTVPFGLMNHYDKDFFGRYDSTRASIRVIDIAPSVAYRLHPRVSIGGGIDVQYAEAKLVNALPTPGVFTPATDGQFMVEGSDWSVGFNVGALFKPQNDIRVGITYRSAIDHKIEGDATTDFGGRTVQSFSTDFNLPDTTSIGVAYDISRTVTLLGQVNYYGWSRFKEVRLKLADGTEPTTTENFRDTWSLALGAQWAPVAGWTLRGGMLYDQTPTRDQYRSTIIPDVDRLWASIGASYEFSDSLALDISFQHMFAKDGPINRTNSFPALGTTVQTTGTTETSSNVMALTLRVQF